jgi:hypothetical protein
LPATDNVIDVVRDPFGNRQDPAPVSPLAWATALAALTALASVGLALATMTWVAVPPDTPHPRAVAILAGAVALVALLTLPQRPMWLAVCLLLAAVLAVLGAIDDPRQSFAPVGYVATAAVTAISRRRPCWADYPKTYRYAVGSMAVFAMGSVYATRVALDSDWQLSVTLGVIAMGLVVIAIVWVALWLAWRRANQWPLLLVTIALTLWTIGALPSIGGVFVLPVLALWVVTVRSFRRARTPVRTRREGLR